MGSGFQIGPRHVMTAFHVVEGVFATNTTSYSIDVTLNKKVYPGAKLIGWDSLSDVAVLELPQDVPFPYTAYKLFGNSDRLSQGDPVYCLGYHEAYRTSTLTEGVVGAVKREAPEVGYWVQVDANVAPGASGGLLIGKDGLIYGMIVAGTYLHDINFMVPSNLIMVVLDRLRSGIEVTRPWLGLLLEENPDPAKKEIRIIDVFPSSPIGETNLRGEPVLRRIDDIPVSSIKKAQDVVMNMNAGNVVKISYADGGVEKDRWVVLARRPDYPVYYAVKDNNKFSSLYPHFGFEIDRRKGQTIAYSGKSGKANLFMYTVTRVQPNTFLDSRGLKVGDRVGFIYDYFDDKTRYIQILHIPRNYTLNDIKDVELFIYTMEKSCYDGTIL
jgi:serine protease Do